MREPLGCAERARGLVERGYDAVAERYLDLVARTDGDPRLRFLDDLAGRLPEGAEVLDLGCGAGRPNAERLARRLRVTGVDVSARQLELARAAVPGATFVQADMTEVGLAPRSFDAVVALYSITHVPREDHAALLMAIARWLRPGALLLASLGCSDTPGVVEEGWLGAPMFFSSHPPEANRRLLAEAGFELLHDEVIAMREDGAEAAFQWVLGRVG